MKTLHIKFLCIAIGLLLHTGAFADDVMVTVTATTVYPEATVIEFAKANGWEETVPNPAYDPNPTIKDMDGETDIPNPDYSADSTIPNPQTYKQFIEQITEARLVAWMTEHKAREINDYFSVAAVNQKQQLQAQASQALTVTAE